MNNPDPFAFDVNSITNIDPKYNFNENSDGKFEVYVDHKLGFTVRFGAFMDHKLELDRNENGGELFMFLMNNYHKKTISHAIHDLYDIGFPVDQWVKDYIEYLTNESSRYATMFRLLTTLRDFGDDLDDLASGSIDD